MYLIPVAGIKADGVFTAESTLGATSSEASDQASISLTTTAALAVGDFAIVAIAVDNHQTTDGDEGAVSSVVTQQAAVTIQSWTKAREYTNGQGGAKSGATISLWYVVATVPMPAGCVIKASFTFSTDRDRSAISAYKFLINGSVVEVAAGASLATDAAAIASLNATTPNEYLLRVRAIAIEDNASTALTPTAGWTAISGISTSGAGGGSGNIGVRGEFRYLLSTGTASAPTLSGVSADNSNVYVALRTY